MDTAFEWVEEFIAGLGETSAHLDVSEMLQIRDSHDGKGEMQTRKKCAKQVIFESDTDNNIAEGCRGTRG